MIDIDGTLADFTRAFYHAAHRAYNQASHTTWEFSDLAPEELVAAWRHIERTPWWWWGLSPLTDCWARIDAMTKIRPVYFVTARAVGTPEVLFQTTSWLRCMGIENPCVIRTEQKGKLAALLKAGWLLDDKPDHVYDTLTFSPRTQAVLLLRPYNVSEILIIKGYGGLAVNDVEEFLKEVEHG